MIKSLLNRVRNLLIFHVRYPWVRYGRNVHCQFSTRFWSPRRRITLGNNVGIGPGCLFLSDTTVGNHVLIAASCAFLNSDDHRIDVVGKPIWDSGRGDQHEIVIEDDVWIGHGAIVLSPAWIRTGTVVGAGSLVRGTLDEYSIYAGVPARRIRARFTPEDLARHKSILAGKPISP